MIHAGGFWYPLAGRDPQFEKPWTMGHGSFTLIYYTLGGGGGKCALLIMYTLKTGCTHLKLDVHIKNYLIEPKQTLYAPSVKTFLGVGLLGFSPSPLL